ncbi:hypothetical protein SCHPADRAFT_819049 [Schizopora paradoxa]|uniref:Zn(2)-C6 fungal-type domain-containing protein n=1 Tax=Schizopora paradoxa TaxID=27342 RepID=A0A0H2S4A0_9AGAM|nr:hypothetical protein SCHPADRAFT_819049 [Schizopora paradoxa]
MASGIVPYDAQSIARQSHSQNQAGASSSTFHHFDGNGDGDDDDDQAASGKKRGAKRRKVNHACVFCRRSHMTCDDGRPCQRCIRREIGHLCHDERRASRDAKSPDKQGESMSLPSVGADNGRQPGPAPWGMNSLGFQQGPLTNEFSFLTEFLENLDDSPFFSQTPPQPSLDPNPPAQIIPIQQDQTMVDLSQQTPMITSSTSAPAPTNQPLNTSQPPTNVPESNAERPKESVVPQILPSASKKEKFLLMAADQEAGSRDERLNRVIQAKYEAGLLKPYDYVKGYARLSRWMDRNVSQDSKQQILQPLSLLRPKFRSIASTLSDLDLVFIEEAFERLLLDYDRVFSAMGIPACLWRRTGEIYKGNREFAELVGVSEYMLRDGRLCIYEVMGEESAVNFWEKYGQVAFDSTQKAVLTSCMLRYKPTISFPTSGHTTPVPHRSSTSSKVMPPPAAGAHTSGEEGFVNCCFSFTIRRDFVGIPIMIVGNFIKC